MRTSTWWLDLILGPLLAVPLLPCAVPLMPRVLPLTPCVLPLAHCLLPQSESMSGTSLAQTPVAPERLRRSGPQKKTLPLPRLPMPLDWCAPHQI